MEEQLREALRELLDVTCNPVKMPKVFADSAVWDRYHTWQCALQHAKTRAAALLGQKGE